MQRFNFSHLTNMYTQTFSIGRRRLIQTCLYKFVAIVLRVPIQCNMAETSLNRTFQIL